MMRALALIAAASGLFSAALAQTSCSGVKPSEHPFEVADGYTAVKVAGGLTSPRHIAVDPRGRLLVIQEGVGVWQYDTDSSTGCVGGSRHLVRDTSLNHGIALGPEGKKLYVSSATKVWALDYNPETGNVPDDTLSDDLVVVRGMNVNGHTSRSLAVAPHRPGLLVVSVGSNGNLDGPTDSPDVGRAIVKVFEVNGDKVPQGGHDYASGGWVAGYGLRNEVGLAFDAKNMLWGLENGADGLTRTVDGKMVDIQNDNPAEELNYLGDVTTPNEQWYGYPTCHTVWKAANIAGGKLTVGQQFVLKPSGDTTDSMCADKAKAPRLALPPHSAPLGAAFDSTGENLYVSLHGSWNSAASVGYKLVVVPFIVRNSDSGNSSSIKADDGPEPAAGSEPVAGADSTSGFKDVFYAPDEGSCSADSCARPVGLAFNKDGSRLYMTSDSSGEVFMVTKKTTQPAEDAALAIRGNMDRRTLPRRGCARSVKAR